MSSSYSGITTVSHSTMVPHSSRRPGAKPIDSRKFRGGLQRLHRYRLAVQLQGTPIPPSFDSSAPFMPSGVHQQTLSTASQTNPLDDSESSIGTSITEFTTIFSADNGVERPEPEKKGLAQVPKARKALLRYLGACEKGCRDRKVKCFLSHHALEDMLDGQHSATDQEDVKWALENDWDPRQTPMIHPLDADLESSVATLVPAMADETVIERANRMLGLQSTPDALYPQRIEDPDDTFLGPESFSLYQDVADFSYSTAQTPGTFPLGMRNNSFEGDLPIFQHYQCLWVGCEHTYQSHEDLQLHFSKDHVNFIRIQPDPLRLACPSCFKFYPGPEGFCTNQFCLSQMVLVEYICGEVSDDAEASTSSLDNGAVVLPGGESSPNCSKNDPSESWQGYQNNTLDNQGHGNSSYNYGFNASFTNTWSQQSRNSNIPASTGQVLHPEYILATLHHVFRERQVMKELSEIAKYSLQLGRASNPTRLLAHPWYHTQNVFLQFNQIIILLFETATRLLVECALTLCQELSRFNPGSFLPESFHLLNSAT